MLQHFERVIRKICKNVLNQCDKENYRERLRDIKYSDKNPYGSTKAPKRADKDFDKDRCQIPLKTS